jgi:amino acid transporter, AAT family
MAEERKIQLQTILYQSSPELEPPSPMFSAPTDHLTSYGTINRSIPRRPPLDDQDDEDSVDTTTQGTLHRSLSSRQVQMIAIAGTIGTGLFLGTGRSLAQGGPGTMLICYSIVGFVVYITLLLLGEMATQYPVAGESLDGDFM